jgi:N-acetylgalactosamine-N,N'-diacetylbacillosaminyl-diphospho-undecaprenol 4-alpha-N-acetylgalactosaminyltransferase
MNKPKIALFITRLDYGGAEKVVRILLEELHHRYDIHLVLTVKLQNVAIPDGVQTLYLSELETRGWRNFAKIPVQSRQLKRYLIANEISLIFSFLLRPNLITAFTRYWGWRGTIILSERSSPISFYSLQGRSGKLVLFLIKKIFPKADLIVPNSYGATHELRDILKIKTNYEVIYNPIDIPLTQKRGAATLENEGENAIDFTRFTFISVGHLHPYKNHKLLLAAFARLENLDCQLLIVGDGIEGDNLKQQTKALGLEKRVIFVGYDVNPVRYMSRSHCFVTATNVEGLPNVHLEALCLGLPIISTDCVSGPRELLAPKTSVNFTLKTGIEIAEFGILTPINNLESLAEAMRYLHNDEKLRHKYNQKGIIRAIDFAKPQIIEKFTAMLDTVYKKIK